MALPYDLQTRGMRPAEGGVPIRRNFGDIEQGLDVGNLNSTEIDLGRRNLGVVEQNLGRQNLGVVEQNLGRQNLSGLEQSLGRQNLDAMDQSLGQKNLNSLEQYMGSQNLYHMNADPATDRIMNQPAIPLMGNSPLNVLAAETAVPTPRPADYVPIGKDRAGATLYGPPARDRAGGRVGATTLGTKTAAAITTPVVDTAPAAPAPEQKVETPVTPTVVPETPAKPPVTDVALKPTRDTIEIPNARGGTDSISSTDLAGMERVRGGIAARGGIGGMSAGGGYSAGNNDFWKNRGYESAADYSNQQKQAAREAQMNMLLQQSMMTPDPSTMTPGEVGATRAQANAAREALKVMGGLDVERSREASLGGYRKASLEASRQQHADALAELRAYHTGSLGMRQQEMESSAKHQKALEDVASKNYGLNLAEQQNKATEKMNAAAGLKALFAQQNQDRWFSPSSEELAFQDAVVNNPSLYGDYLKTQSGFK